MLGSSKTGFWRKRTTCKEMSFGNALSNLRLKTSQNQEIKINSFEINNSLNKTRFLKDSN